MLMNRVLRCLFFLREETSVNVHDVGYVHHFKRKGDDFPNVDDLFQPTTTLIAVLVFILPRLPFVSVVHLTMDVSLHFITLLV